MAFVVVMVVNAPKFITSCSTYGTMSENKNITKNLVESAPSFFSINFDFEEGSADSFETFLFLNLALHSEDDSRKTFKIQRHSMKYKYNLGSHNEIPHSQILQHHRIFLVSFMKPMNTNEQE